MWPAAIAEEKAAGQQVVGFLSDARAKARRRPAGTASVTRLLFLTICLINEVVRRGLLIRTCM